MDIENDNINNINYMNSDSEEYNKEIQVELTEISDEPLEINSENDEKQILDFTNLEVNKIDKEELYTPEEAPEIKYENYLSEPIREEFLSKTPFQLFEYVFDDFVKTIIEYSEKFAEKRLQLEIELDKDDIYKYLFVNLFLSVYNFHSIDELWENNSLIQTIVPQIISKNMYWKISKVFYISQYSELVTPHIPSNNKSEKIDEMISYFNRKWKEIYPYSQNLTVDESMTTCKGKIVFRQFMKDKHKKFGIKFFTKSNSSNGYVYDLLPYTGKGFDYNKEYGLGASVLIKMIKGHEKKNFHFCFDNFYANVHSIIALYRNEIDFTCTFSKNRKGFHQELKEVEAIPNETKVFQIKNTDIKFIYFKDNTKKKQVQFISSKYGEQIYKYRNKAGKVRIKPEVVCYYNLNKSGVDLTDMSIQIFKSQRRFSKWWKAIFFIY